MQVNYSLNLQQAQRLVMTPELKQAIAVLQLPILELRAYIEQELLNNPLLEMREPEDEEAADGELGEAEIEWLEYFQDSSDVGYIAGGQAEGPGYETFLSEAPTLQDHLLFQLHLAISDPMEKKIGEYIIGSLDQHGYLRSGAGDIAARLGVSQGAVEKVLRTMQEFDPPGICARDLVECLLNQLDMLGIPDGLVREVVRRYLGDVAEGRLQKIASELDVSIHAVQSAVDLIRTLDPKPGRHFGHRDEIRYVIPDVIVERVNDEYVVIVNDSLLPKLTVNNFYRKLLANGRNGESETKKYIEQKLSSAFWFIKSIEQRRLTLLRVVECIVKHQVEFLNKGIRYLKPLTLRQVAESIGIHESTVSRATSEKYVQTPRGLYELRFFFKSGVESLYGGSVSSESIKRMIADLVESEDPRNPLSDQKITSILNSRGILISRRTVAKYRDELGIAGSQRRKRY